MSAVSETPLCCGVSSCVPFHSTAQCCSVVNMASFVSKLIAFLTFWNLSEHLIELHELHLSSICTVVNNNELKDYNHRDSCCVVEVQLSVLTNPVKDHFACNFEFSICKSFIRTSLFYFYLWKFRN